MARIRRRTGAVTVGLGAAQYAVERALKTELLHQIAARLEAEGSTQTVAAQRLGISQPDVSRMLRGDYRQFSVERLMRFLLTLGQEIEIRVRPAQTSCMTSARITVIAA
jgi:predicted XRE-type DNA-binding protein